MIKQGESLLYLLRPCAKDHAQLVPVGNFKCSCESTSITFGIDFVKSVVVCWTETFYLNMQGLALICLKYKKTINNLRHD